MQERSKGNYMRKRTIIMLMPLLLAAALAFIYANHQKYTQPTLTIGVCSDSYWDVPSGDSNALTEKAVAVFQAQHPEVKVKLLTGIQKADYHEWLSEHLLDGSEPDLFLIIADNFYTYTSIGALMNLTPMIKADADFNPDSYYPSAIKACRQNGEYYALPLEAVPDLMFVNKSLLAKHHIDMPDNNWTWQDFYDICRKITCDLDGDGRPDAYGSYAYGWTNAALANNVRLFSDDCLKAYINTPQMKSSLRFIIQLRELNRGYEVSARDFNLGRVAFRPLTFAEYRTYQPYPWRIKKYSAFDWDVVTFPAGPDGKNISHIHTMRMGISSRTEHPELAWELLKTLSYNQEIQTHVIDMSQGLPARRDIISTESAGQLFKKIMREDDSNLTLTAIDAIMSDAAPIVSFPKYHGAIMRADTCIEKIISGILPMDSALNQLQADINSYLLQ